VDTLPGVIAARLKAAATDPAAAAYALRVRLRRDGLFARYGELSRRAGLDRVWLVLSFDCDTPEDAAVVEGVHERLMGMGVRPVYAVPGALLREADDVYGRIASSGAEFINHGNRMHAYVDEETNRWASSFFYDQQPRATIRKDIVDADATLREVIGRGPAGFRTPHFGTFQSPEQLRWLHGVISELGYGFSTSTVPLWGFRHGPAFERFGRLELPVTGGVADPLSTLDTWSCFEAPDRVRTPADYRAEASAVGDAYAQAGAGVLNVYGDPSHIHDREEFFRAVEHWISVAVPAGYTELLGALR
jgi:Polysaccharide deacetylase